MGYGTLVSLVFHNLPSLYPSSFCRNDFLYFIICEEGKLNIVFQLLMSLLVTIFHMFAETKSKVQCHNTYFK